MAGYIPKHEINITMGDWNVRLRERLPDEEQFIGPHIFREETAESKT